MATAAQILASRATAGATYASAAQALIDAWVALAAYDMAVEATGGPKPQPHFTDMPSLLVHPTYLPRVTRDGISSPNVVTAARDSQAKTIIGTWDGT